jgi:hypothetical protein
VHTTEKGGCGATLSVVVMHTHEGASACVTGVTGSDDLTRATYVNVVRGIARMHYSCSVPRGEAQIRLFLLFSLTSFFILCVFLNIDP